MTNDTLPPGCGYMGQDFGAPYIDSQCFGGRLYDLNDGDEGVLNEPDEYLPCPKCRHDEWLANLLERCGDHGAFAFDEGLPRECNYCRDEMSQEDLEKCREAFFAGYDTAAEAAEA